MNRIGLGIITCNREDFYQKCLQSIPHDKLHSLVTVNDGGEYNQPPSTGEYVRHKENKGVGKSKNEAMQHLLDKGCDHIFLIEDDIIVKDESVFQKYIDTAAASGMWHLMFGYHGPANKNANKENVHRCEIRYGEHRVALNQHCVGAFCYYHKGVLNNIGLMDEQYKNAWEHVDHSYQIVKAGLLPAYWWWPDVSNSCEYLTELACSEDNSTIRWEDGEQKKPKKDWEENVLNGAHYFYSKHGSMPGQVPDSSAEQVEHKLQFIKKNYSRHEVRS